MNRTIKPLSGVRRISTAWRRRNRAHRRLLPHAAQGLEERKQILYLLGPVGGGKSSLAERLKA
jgi:predicted Ser/Thr protein kinase